MLTVVETDSTNVFVNQGVEKALFDSVCDGELILYVWSNDKAVVIGRNQDAQSECRVDLLQSEKGLLARRLSGGGAVFHDLGNVNYTFIARSKDISVDKNLKIVLCALKSFGIDASFSGRNDIEVDGFKIGGSAYYKKDGTEFQHGTMLIDSTAEDVSRYLTPPNEKFHKKAVKSVKSRVTNLKSINPNVTAEQFVSALKTALKEEFSGAKYRSKKPIELGAAAILPATAFFASDEWRYGKKEEFDLRMPLVFEDVKVEVGFIIANEAISDAIVFTDSLDLGLTERIKTDLIGMDIKTANGEIPERIRGEWYGV